MKRLAIFGASGHGKVIADIGEVLGWSQVEFYDDAWPAKDANGRWPVVGNMSSLEQCVRQYEGVIVAIGNNKIRATKLESLRQTEAPLVTLVHPSAVVSRYSNLGVGSIVMPGAIVNVDCSIGDGAILNTGCSIDHDCILEECVQVSPGARLAGGVKLGSMTWIGIGACVRQMITIGANTIVGAGAVVINDLPDDVTAVGVPATILS